MRREAALAAPVADRSPRAAPPLGTMATPKVPVPAIYRFSWRALPRDLKLLAIGLVLVVVGSIAWLFVPWHPKPIVPLLGWSEPTSSRPLPTPPPRKPEPSPSPAGKKGWLPW
jgi:hypothetical protein